jgi:hypothetical protein
MRINFFFNVGDVERQNVFVVVPHAETDMPAEVSYSASGKVCRQLSDEISNGTLHRSFDYRDSPTIVLRKGVQRLPSEPAHLATERHRSQRPIQHKGIPKLSENADTGRLSVSITIKSVSAFPRYLLAVMWDRAVGWELQVG